MLSSYFRRTCCLLAAVGFVSVGTFAGASAQQAGTVTGVVTAATDGRPLAGVQVHFPALQQGGLTNSQGRFLLPGIPAGRYEIVAQRIGFRTLNKSVEVSAGQTATVDFSLEERAISMQGLVVTGVAAQTPQTEVPFTVAKVDADQVSKTPVTSVGGMLTGQVAGVKVVQGSGEPGSEPSFELRGPTSITGTQEPLVVIDGVITRGGISDVDPADIQSIEIVKGAAGAALYGSRAQAGVIEITTKTGSHLKSGQTQFIYRGTYEANSIEHYYGIATHHQWAMNADKTAILDVNGNPITFPYRGTPALNDGGNGRNAFTTFMVNPYPPGIKVQDPVQEFFRPGGRFSNYLAIAGNQGGTNYRISFDQTHEQGAIKMAKGLDQYNARVNVSQTLGQFQMQANAYLSKRDRGLLAQGGGGIIRTLTFTTAAANLLARDSTGAISPIGEPIYQGNVGRNPIYDLVNTTDDESRTRGMGSIDLNWKPLSWVSFQGNGSFDRIDTNTHYYQRPGLIRPFNTPGLGEISDANDLRLEMNGSLTAAFNFTFGGGDFTMRSRLRYLVESLDESGFSVDGQNLPVQQVQRLSLIGGTPTLDSYKRSVRSEGYFAIASLTYKDRYILDLLGRRDGSSLFGADQRWQNYHRLSFAWRISQEPWFHVGWLTELKPRYSIGTSGGRPSFEAQYQTYQVSAGSITPLTLGNKDLKPELATEQEFGLDAVIAQRLQITANYVKTKIQNELLLVPLASIAGFSNQWQNAATVESNTRELSLEAALLERRNLTWTARLNLDNTKNRITQLGVAPYRISDYRAGLYIRQGEVLGSYYGWRYPTSCKDLPAGTDCGQFQVNDDGYFVYVGTGNSYKDGKSKNLWGTTGVVNGVKYSWGLPISALNSTLSLPDQKLGDSQPSLNASFQQNLEWKNFGATLQFDGEWGAQVYNQTMQWRCRDGHCPMMDQTGKPDELQKPITYYNALGFYQNNKNNSYFTENADYVKLRQLSLRYTLPESRLPAAMKKAGINQATINLTGRNLKTWTKYRGFDPEVGSNTFGGSAAVGRIDEYFYPNYRSIGISVELVF